MDSGPLTFRNGDNAACNARCEFGIVAGRERDAAEQLPRHLDGGAEVSLCNDLDEGLEGRTHFRKSRRGYDRKVGGHGWQGNWEAVDRQAVLAAIIALADHNRGGHWSTSGSIEPATDPDYKLFPLPDLRRLRRRLVNLLTALSLLLCMAALVLWVRALWVADRIDRRLVVEQGTYTVITEWTFATTNGALQLTHSCQKVLTEDAAFAWPEGTWDWEVFDPDGTRWTSFDFESDSSAGVTNSVAYRHIELPHWLPVVILGIAPALWVSRRLLRHPPGRCPSCGYNLTGNISGICPECGEKP